MAEWPFPGDLPVDRARQVAGEYRAALERVAPDASAAIDQAAVWAGESWVVPQVATELADDWIEVRQAAMILGRSRRWVYTWTQKNPDLILTDPVRVRLLDVQAFLATQRVQPIRGRGSGPRSG